jgi:hypothetical protein
MGHQVHICRFPHNKQQAGSGNQGRAIHWNDDEGARMTELSFKGKEFAYNHHLAVSFRPLVPYETKGIGPVALEGNLVIHGDNLHALKALWFGPWGFLGLWSDLCRLNVSAVHCGTRRQPPTKGRVWRPYLNLNFNLERRELAGRADTATNHQQDRATGGQQAPEISSFRIVEDDPQAMPLPRADTAHAMTQIDAIGALGALHGAVMDGEGDGIALTHGHHLGAALHPGTLFGQHELAAGKIALGL